MKHFLRVCFLIISLTWQNFGREKWQEVSRILNGFVFVLLFLNLVFTSKGSLPRISADLLKLQSRIKESIHIIILMKSIIPFFIHSFHVLKFFYEQGKSKNTITYTKKYVYSDWLRRVQYWSYLCSLFNMCTHWLNKKETYNIRIP